MMLIDTSAWIEFFRKDGKPDIKNRVAGYIDLEQAAYCGPVEFELMTGARDPEIDMIRTALDFSVLLDFPLACWQEAAKIESQLRKRGVTVPRDDIFVAAAALQHNTPVYASDPHFLLMKNKGRLPLKIA